VGVCVSWPQRGSPSPGACWEHATHHARAYAPITRDANATIGTASHSGGTAIVVPPWQLCLGCVKQTAWCGHSRNVVRVALHLQFRTGHRPAARPAGRGRELEPGHQRKPHARLHGNQAGLALVLVLQRMPEETWLLTTAARRHHTHAHTRATRAADAGLFSVGGSELCFIPAQLNRMNQLRPTPNPCPARASPHAPRLPRRAWGRRPPTPQVSAR